MVSILSGGHVKISSPSRRPRLYLNPGDKGYIGSGTPNGAAATGGIGAADGYLVDSERQVGLGLGLTKQGMYGGLRTAGKETRMVLR